MKPLLLRGLTALFLAFGLVPAAGAVPLTLAAATACNVTRPACYSQGVLTSQDPDINYEFNDFPAIYLDALATETPGCRGLAAEQLNRKITNTLNAGGHYQGWLAGDSVGHAFAAALELQYYGAPVNDVVMSRMRDSFAGIGDTQDPAGPCATHTNGCMDDYTLTASGFAWLAAYEAKQGRSANAAFYAQHSKDLLVKLFAPMKSSTGSPAYGSVCYFDPGTPAGLTCGGSSSGVGSSTRIIGVGHQQENPSYGFGLMMGVASACAALYVAGSPCDFGTVDPATGLSWRDIATELARHARLKTAQGSQPLTFQPAGCLDFHNGNPYGSIDCGDPSYHYVPEHYPLKRFYSFKVGYDFSDFGSDFRFDRWDPDYACRSAEQMYSRNAFYGLNRYVLYNLIGNEAWPGGSLNAHVNALAHCVATTAPAPVSLPADTVWVEDQPPPGAVLEGSWIWDPAQSASGTRSQTEPAAPEIHQHFFYNAPPFPVAVGDHLVAYVLIDACNPPQEVMLQWNVGGSWEHRAYWGQDLIPWGGTPPSAGKYPMGALPAGGQWARLEVPAALVGLEGQQVNGMAFSLYGDGHAWFDRAGKIAPSCVAPTAPVPAPLPADSVWVEDQTPPGAALAGNWTWDPAQKASGTQSHTEPGAAGIHQHYFYNAAPTLPILAGDRLVAYVLLDLCNPPQEVMLQWNVGGSWEHRAYWGQDLIPWGGTPPSAGKYPMGGLPAAGQWVRLEIPATLVGLEGQQVNGMAFSLYDGHAWFDRAGRSVASTISVASATYGGNCGAPTGNVTPQLAVACNGRTSCPYTVSYQILGDPSPGCAKTYVAQWRCGSSATTYTTNAPAEAGFGSEVTLACN